ncbi:type II toxin-antitoxin system RelE/ParE family toxin [Pontivivens ytuae]|uniref:Type II toxin-antitoxin system RelE/ParE family toxin n=1 Tax=Pontivivens ytuae TaxID=2789856 RepID=A0A7S9LTZ9_9RHOB|nr:type II toxin-antitoxin system RelE/ParE family toxin [Pontivivens ytuae]QPH55212.1 type II toxin-antitoxin system RelE/ParE family toxin [Pontivivens ytuae]
MNYRLVIVPQAEDDLQELALYLRSVLAQERARAYLRDIERFVLDLPLAPHRGSVRDELAPGLRAIPIRGSTVVVFQVDEDTQEVRILRIAAGGSDWMKTFGARA